MSVKSWLADRSSSHEGPSPRTGCTKQVDLVEESALEECADEAAPAIDAHDAGHWRDAVALAGCDDRGSLTVA